MKEKLEMNTKFWFENRNGKAHLENLGIDGMMMMMIIIRQGVNLSQILRIATNSRLL
jgi:hypothetical protein